MIKDCSTELSYMSILPAQVASSNGNSAAVNVVGYLGKLAVIVATNVPNVTNAVWTGYFQTGTTTNQLAATNVNFTAPNGGNAVVQTNFVTNGTNQVQIFGIDQRLLNTYLFFTSTINGVNSASIVSVTLVGQKKVENS